MASQVAAHTSQGSPKDGAGGWMLAHSSPQALLVLAVILIPLHSVSCELLSTAGLLLPVEDAVSASLESPSSQRGVAPY